MQHVNKRVYTFYTASVLIHNRIGDEVKFRKLNMDAAQFQALLQAITTSNERLEALITNQNAESKGKSAAEDSGTVTFLSNFEHFDSSKETFIQYKE